MLSLVLMDPIYHRDMHWNHSKGIAHFLVLVDNCVEGCNLSVTLASKFHFVVILMDA